MPLKLKIRIKWNIFQNLKFILVQDFEKKDEATALAVIPGKLIMGVFYKLGKYIEGIYTITSNYVYQ